MQTSTVNPSTFECLAHYLCIYIHIEGRDDLKGLKIAVFDMHSCSTVEVNETSGAQNLKKKDVHETQEQHVFLRSHCEHFLSI